MSPVLLDLILIGFIVLALIRGYQRGLIVSLLGFVGFLAGGVAGLVVGPQFIDGLGPVLRLVSLIAIVLTCANLAQALTMAIANAIRSRLLWRPLRFIDSLFGTAFTVIGTVLLVWALAAVLRVSPFTSVTNAVAQSKVVAVLDARVPDLARNAVAQARRVVEGSNFPQVFAALGPEPYLDATPPDEKVVNSQSVRQAFASVAKINGAAVSCRRLVEGSGFVVAPKYVMTNAHVVAGVERPSIQLNDQRFSGRVVYFDPKKDIAILYVPSATSNALDLDFSGESGTSAVVAGFPGNGPFNARAARIRGEITALGDDIYGKSRVTRQVFAITSSVRPGNSGGPLLSTSGEVLGMVFARSTIDNDTGYVLTANELKRAMAGISTQAVSTGPCD